MKHGISLLLAPILLLLCSLTSCSGEPASNNTAKNPSENVPENTDDSSENTCSDPAAPDNAESDDSEEPVATRKKLDKNPEDITVAFLGDSITLGYALEHQSDRFTDIIAGEYGIINENCGICGTLMTRAGQNRTDGNSYLDRLKLIKDADIAVIFGGTNDYFWSDRPIYPPEGEEATEDYFSVAFEKICWFASTRRDKDFTLLVTPYPHQGVGNYEGGSSYTASSTHETNDLNYNSQRMADYMACIIETAEKYDIPVLNLHTDSDFDYKTMTIDGCHPNEVGHEWLAEKNGAAIREMYE
jgi:lysophospholipase L1-like esterase